MQQAGEIGGARFYTAGRGFGVPGGYPPLQPDAGEDEDVYRPGSVEEARAAVAELAQRDVHFVKFWVDHHFETLPDFSPEIYRAAIEEARRLGLRPVAHIHTLKNAHGVVDAGIDVGVAGTLALWFSVALLAAFGGLAAHAAGLRGRQLVLETFVGALFGVAALVPTVLRQRRGISILKKPVEPAPPPVPPVL